MNEKEKKFPIYSITATWFENKNPERDYSDRQIESVPEGMVLDSTQFYKAFKTEPSEIELEKAVRDWWSRWSIYKNKRNGAQNPIIIIRFSENETWWLTWFEHVTFDVGQSNEEVLESFERYVDRKKEIGCYLMRAEDRYRWHGAEPDGDPKNISKPPCRCKYCKEQGLIRIAH